MKYREKLYTIAIVLFLLVFPSMAVTEEFINDYQLDIHIDKEKALLTGIARISLKGDIESQIEINGLQIKTMTLNNQTLTLKPSETVLKFRPERDSILEIEYTLNLLKMMGNKQWEMNYFGDNGISLLSNWYPRVQKLAIYKLKASVPAHMEAMSEANTIEVSDKGETREFTFHFPYPLNGINLIAGKYETMQESVSDIVIHSYFFKEDGALAQTYLEHTKNYIKLYEELIGKFPFKRFSVVENFLPTGYSMPTFTLLGRSVVRLPFIVKTSLGHEIMHQWFGNSVYVDYEKGNWSEGLTTYLADHLYNVQKGEGAAYRKRALIKYNSYTTKEGDFPLKDFRVRTDELTMSIGYGKCAMLFHMLKDITGEDIFYKALKFFIKENQFRAVSWQEIEEAFEKSSAMELSWFFEQWVEETGAPLVSVKDISIFKENNSWVAQFKVTSHNQNFKRLSIPITFKTENGEVKKRVDLRSGEKQFRLSLASWPSELIVDKDYDLFRTLTQNEVYPTIAGLMGDTQKIIVTPADGLEKYRKLTAYFIKKGFKVVKEDEVDRNKLQTTSSLFLDRKNRFSAELFDLSKKPEEGFRFTTIKHPYNPNRVMAFATGERAVEIDLAFPKIVHYGNYSEVAFKQGKNILKSINKSDNGMIYKIRKRTSGVEVSAMLDLEEIIEKVSSKKIIYIGEMHSMYEHHLAQLEIIRALYNKNHDLAIGMEMFQREYQKVLDDYINEAIGEKEMLEKSRYFKTWSFNFKLYRDILNFARENGIPIVALNQERKIVSKVNSKGLDSLSDDEKKRIPEEIDTSDEEYKARLHEIFNMHSTSVKKSFDNFFHAQLLWDETMAESIDNYLKKNPTRTMAVIAGNGHLAYGSGIPKRAFRRGGYDYSIILNDENIEKGKADFILFPEKRDTPQTPLLMVMLKKSNEGLIITGFTKNSISEKAGMKKNDIILSLDETEIKEIEDIKLFLLYKKKGETVKVGLRRDRFLLGSKDIEVEVLLK